MIPVPLTDPSGIVRGWMCGSCMHVHSSEGGGAGNADADDVKASAARAEHCCRCSRCDAPSPRAEQTWGWRACAACNAQQAALDAERQKTHEYCSGCDGTGLGLRGDCRVCDGEGWVLRKAVTP